MTEYDYSPEAYDRFMANQSRVSNWVSHTIQHERKYVNPFEELPASYKKSNRPNHTRHQSSSGATASRPHAYSHSRENSSSTTVDSGGRPMPSRSQTTPQQSSTRRTHSHRSHNSQSNTYYHDKYTSSPTRSRSIPKRSYTTDYSYGRDDGPGRRPVRSNTSPAHVPYRSKGGTDYLIPANHTGFVIVEGKQVDVVPPYQSPYQYGPPADSQPYYSSAPHPKRPALLKRLFRSITGNSLGGSSSGHSRRRSY